MRVGAYMPTFLYFNAKIMSIKIHFKVYRTAHLQIYKWLMYTHNIIQKILEKKNKQTNKNKTKVNRM